jgi:uncharacterized protein
MKSAIYVGEIAHQRNLPKVHRFRYPFFMWFLNLDELKGLPDLGWWFSVQHWATHPPNGSTTHQIAPEIQ